MKGANLPTLMHIHPVQFVLLEVENDLEVHEKSRTSLTRLTLFSQRVLFFVRTLIKRSHLFPVESETTLLDRACSKCSLANTLS